MDQWDTYYNSLKALWPECGCFDLDECDDETHDCSAVEHCVNTHGSYKCINAEAMSSLLRSGPKSVCPIQ